MKKRISIERIAFTAVILFLISSVTALAQTTPAVRLRYADAANGQLGSQTLVTTLLVSNLNNFPIQAYIDSFDDANPANSMNLGLTTNCSFDPSTNNFTIPAGSSCLFVSDGGVNPDGSLRALKTGWLRATEATGNYPIGGYLVFTSYQGIPSAGFPLFTVGVSPTPIFDELSIAVVRNRPTNQDIGFAMANPFNDGPTTMVAQLVDSTGNVVEQTNITVPTLGHVAEYLSQLFPNTLANASNFVGNLFVFAQTSLYDGAVATVLIQQGNLFGGAPPTSDSIFSYKRADSLSLRENAGAARAHETLRATTLPGLF